MEQVTGRFLRQFHNELRRRRALARAMGMVLATALAMPFCRGDEPTEYQVKAAFLLNFTKFVEWPAQALPPDSPIEICVLGDDPFGAVLDEILAGEAAGAHKITARRIKHSPVPRSCSVLFVGRPDRDILKMLPEIGPGLLTVGEGDRFIRDGGMIAFVMVNRRVRFDINQKAAENAGLKLSSKLLNVARSVER